MKKAIVLSALSLCLFACEKEEEQVDVITYATLQVQAVADGEGGEIALTSAACVSDPDSGLFTAEFTGPDGSALSMKIKGWTTSSDSYTCSQASDNTSGEVGNKFDTCSVEVSIPDPGSSVNTYAMHRGTTDVKDFEYTGSCTITTTYMEPQVQGSIDCDGLVQTQLQGAPRNPIDNSVTAAITTGSSFSCDL